MGEEADYYIEQMLFHDFEREVSYDARKRNATWTKIDGTTIKVKDMETSHIRNCIALVTRRGKTGTGIYEALTEELERRGYE